MCDENPRRNEERVAFSPLDGTLDGTPSIAATAAMEQSGGSRHTIEQEEEQEGYEGEEKLRAQGGEGRGGEDLKSFLNKLLECKLEFRVHVRPLAIEVAKRKEGKAPQ